MKELKMCQRTILMLILASSSFAQLFVFDTIKSYVKSLNTGKFPEIDSGNELWRGLFRDCSNSSSLSCVQKNVFSYLDDTFEDRDNITVFEGLVLTKNNLDYHKYTSEYNEGRDAEEDNLIEKKNSGEEKRSYEEQENNSPVEDNEADAPSPFEEVTTALQDKAMKFLATRDYEIQLPDLFFEGARLKISPKEVDEGGALIRIDVKERSVERQARIIKQIKKFFKNKLLFSFLALLLIIKLIKVKFMFIIPFLFGIGAAKKLFLKLLLFLVPAFAHVFKLCSLYYTHNPTKYHHHHHQIAHHHHHVPVPVPVPAYHHPHPHHEEKEEEFDGYDYTHSHIQYRKDVEELKEWGIETYDEPFNGPYAQMQGPALGAYGTVQYAANSRPINKGPPQSPPEKYGSHIQYEKPMGAYNNPAPNVRHTLNNIGMSQFNNNFDVRSNGVASNLGPIGNHAQNLAYNGYFDDVRFTRATASVTEATQLRPGLALPKNSGFNVKSDDVATWAQSALQPQQSAKSAAKSPIYVHNAQQQGSIAGSNLVHGNSLPVQSGETLTSTLQNSLPNMFENVQKKQKMQTPQNLSPSLQKAVQNIQTPQIVQNPVAIVEAVKQGSHKLPDVGNIRGRMYDDQFYGPILERLEETFAQLRFMEEGCRERLVCSMYKNPTKYSPHSNLVSNELSRDPEEMRQGAATSASGKRFQHYLSAARSGQDGQDCLKLYPCQINTE